MTAPFCGESGKMSWHCLVDGRGLKSGFSLVEIMVVIGVLSIVVAIAIPSISNVLPGAREATARANLEHLNQAVLKFNYANWELVLASEAGSDDELAIARSLQYRSASDPTPGSPYFAPTLSLVESSDDSTYRAAWNGRSFQMVAPGTVGTGLDLSEMVAGSAPFNFGSDYQPVGAR